MRSLTLAQAKCSAWSGGASQELLILPPGADYGQRNFDYRISMARIEETGTSFTALSGYDRYLTGLDGSLNLELNGDPVSLWQGQVLHFQGEDEVNSHSTGRDLNLMLKRGLPGRVYWAQGELRGPLYVFDPDAETLHTLAPGEAANFGRVAVIDLKAVTMPAQISTLVAGMLERPVGSGLSQARVIRFTDADKTWYLKIDPSEALAHEAEMLGWLQGKLPVPEVIASLPRYLLMSALPGKAAFSDDLESLLEALFDGLDQLRAVPLEGCPRQRGIETQLREALARLEGGQTDPRVEDPWGIYRYLVDNQPAEVPCFNHGDYCLPNVFIHGRRAVGFIDLGKAGIGSAWNDLALCYRSFTKNYPNAPKDLFGTVWGRPIDWDLIHYYIQLDELA